MPEPIEVAGLPLLIGLDRALDPILLAPSVALGLPFRGRVGLLPIGAMLLELLGTPMPAPVLPMLLPLPRGMKVAPEPVEGDGLRVLPVISSMGAGTVLLGFGRCCPNIPMPRSAFPPA